MFNIPGKQALTITETATAQIRKLMEQGNKKGTTSWRQKRRVRRYGIYNGLC